MAEKDALHTKRSKGTVAPSKQKVKIATVKIEAISLSLANQQWKISGDPCQANLETRSGACAT
jgi:hypothetical protein